MKLRHEPVEPALQDLDGSVRQLSCLERHSFVVVFKLVVEELGHTAKPVSGTDIDDDLLADDFNLAGINAARAALGQGFEPPPPETAHGALLGYLGSASASSFQPTNVNFGLFPALPAVSSSRDGVAAVAGDPGSRRARGKLPKRERSQRMASRALAALQPYVERVAPGAE